MGIDLGEIMAGIRERLPDLEQLSAQLASDEELGSRVIRNLSGLGLGEFTDRVRGGESGIRGAIPVPEGTEGPGTWRFIRPFGRSFTDMEQARDWAERVLTGRRVGAVDGSQIYPGGEFSVPVGLVNIGWYVNAHDGAGTYERAHATRLLLPDDLGYTPESGVNLHREEGEIRMLLELFEKQDLHGGTGERDLYLLDGSLVLSFALHVFETTRDRYIRGIMSLLNAVSREQGPLFAGYVDTSRATDLSVMLQDLLSAEGEPGGHVTPGPGDVEESGERVGGRFTDDADDEGGGDDTVNRMPPPPSPWLPVDGILLRSALGNWGDRTTTFLCARDDILRLYRYGDRDHSRSIAFFYMKTSHGRISRVEFPVTIAASGRVEELADVIRAQLIVGGGYPHVLDQAHHEANVTIADRERFLALIRLALREHNITIGTSLKATRKRR